MGKPDLFFMYTIYPKWPEIQDARNPGEEACDDLISVPESLKIKYGSLMDDLLKKNILGRIGLSLQ